MAKRYGFLLGILLVGIVISILIFRDRGGEDVFVKIKETPKLKETSRLDGERRKKEEPRKKKGPVEVVRHGWKFEGVGGKALWIWAVEVKNKVDVPVVVSVKYSLKRDGTKFISDLKTEKVEPGESKVISGMKVYLGKIYSLADVEFQIDVFPTKQTEGWTWSVPFVKSFSFQETSSRVVYDLGG